MRRMPVYPGDAAQAGMRPYKPRQRPEARPARAASEQNVREAAYLKWVAAGRPAGDGVAFWLQAERERR